MNEGNRVYLVDDDLSARRGLCRLLRASGHDARAFSTGHEFLDAVESDASGCLVLDLRLPDMEGEELKSELDARGIRLAIIVISGDDEPQMRQMARRMNAASFFRKPVDGTALLDAIAWGMASSRAVPGHNR